MAYRKLTGQISHRHPFHGYYDQPDMYDVNLDRIDHRIYRGVQGFGKYVPSRQADEIMMEKRYLHSVQGYGEFTAEKVYDMTKEPIVRALFMGLTSYGLAKLVKAQPKVAKRIGLVTGGMEFIISVGSNWLKEELKKAK